MNLRKKRPSLASAGVSDQPFASGAPFFSGGLAAGGGDGSCVAILGDVVAGDALGALGSAPVCAMDRVATTMRPGSMVESLLRAGRCTEGWLCSPGRDSCRYADPPCLKIGLFGAIQIIGL